MTGVNASNWGSHHDCTWRIANVARDKTAKAFLHFVALTVSQGCQARIFHTRTVLVFNTLHFWSFVILLTGGVPELKPHSSVLPYLWQVGTWCMHAQRTLPPLPSHTPQLPTPIPTHKQNWSHSRLANMGETQSTHSLWYLLTVWQSDRHVAVPPNT